MTKETNRRIKYCGDKEHELREILVSPAYGSLCVIENW